MNTRTMPGESFRWPDKPGGRICPHCGRKYTKVKIKTSGKKQTFHCPYCGERVR